MLRSQVSNKNAKESSISQYAHNLGETNTINQSCLQEETQLINYPTQFLSNQNLLDLCNSLQALADLSSDLHVESYLRTVPKPRRPPRAMDINDCAHSLGNGNLLDLCKIQQA